MIVAEILRVIKFLRGVKMIHGGLTPSNILFDEYHGIQIADFGPSRFDPPETAAIAQAVESEFEAPEMRFGEDRTVKIDTFSLALTLVEILVGLRALGRTNTSKELGKLAVKACRRGEIPGNVPRFIYQLIESGLSASPQMRPSFDDVSEALNKNHLVIAEGVDSNKVSPFVSLVESSETCVK